MAWATICEQRKGETMKRDWKLWVKAAGIRAVKTAAQTAVALIPAGVTIAAVDWKVVIGTAALAGTASILTSVSGLPELQKGAQQASF